MQNHPHRAASARPASSSLPLDRLADPRVVLLIVGLFGFAVDQFVRPISWIGLALIVLATSPWILQAWSQRAPPPALDLDRAPNKARPEPGAVPGGQVQRMPLAQPPASPAHEPGRRAPTVEQAATRPLAAGPEPRPAAARPAPPRAG